MGKPARTNSKRLRDRGRRVWARTRRALEAAQVPQDQEAELARGARAHLRLRRHDWKPNVYEARGAAGLVLLRQADGWVWLHPDWEMRFVGPYRTQRAALAAWAAATRDNEVQ